MLRCDSSQFVVVNAVGNFLGVQSVLRIVNIEFEKCLFVLSALLAAGIVGFGEFFL